MEHEKIELGWKDIFALTIAFIQVFAPYAIIAMSVIGLGMYLFSKL